MPQPPRVLPVHTTTSFRSHDGVVLMADACGDAARPPVLLLHGGGQTRHAWRRTALALGERGFHAVAQDLRGHGDSGWSPQGQYSLDEFVLDVCATCASFAVPPIVVGASLGGIVAMLARAERQAALSALVLVDVTPTLQRSGVERIRDFMASARHEGFASVEAAAEAVRSFLPGRQVPPSAAGLSKNLRLGRDGRYRWHWDPAFMDFVDRNAGTAFDDRLTPAARALDVPVLLVRGSKSDVVSGGDAEFLLRLVPTAQAVDIDDATHMVAGDANDAFTAAILAFIERLGPRQTTARE